MKKIHLNKRQIVYTICFLVLCLIDQRVKTASGLEGWIGTFRDFMGVVMSVLILSHYHLKDFIKQKIPYLVWSLICVIGGAVFILYGQPLTYFVNNRIALVCSVFGMGLAVIRTFIAVVLEKRKPVLNRSFGLLWLIMMALMIVSRSEYLWPFAYLVMFGCFYLTDYTKEEQHDLLHGMLNGLILAFFLMQGWCFVFRPYDRVRYVGVYSNSNLNALFYLLVMAAALTKLIYTYRRGGSKWLKLFYTLGVGVVLSFIFMTISRTGWFAAVLVVFAGLVCLWRSGVIKSFFKSMLRNGLLFVLCFALMFPVVYSAVRYFPPVFHHPVWFFGEWSEKRVHSWDGWDSEKYITVDKLLTTAVGRVADVFGALTEDSGADGQPEVSVPHLEVEGVNMADVSSDANLQGQPEASEEPEVTAKQQQLYDEAYAAGFALEPEEHSNPVKVRSAIYRYYLHLLNFTGHPESELGFQIIPSHRIGHAHNIYLQYGVDFGIPVMILFIVLVIWSAISLFQKFWMSRQEHFAGELLILMVPALFGLLEYAWGSGSVAVVLLFVVWRRVICNERES